MKTVLLTFAATITAVVVVASLFLNSILGAFGLAVTSIETLQKLKTTHQIVEGMKERHRQKKLNVSRKLAKKSTKRVASTALASATLGTAAVAVTVATLEVASYCEEKRDLQEEANVLFGTDVEFDFEQCIEEGREDAKALVKELKDSSVEAISRSFDAAAQYSSEKWEEVKDAVQSKGEYVGELWNETKSWVTQLRSE